MYFEFIETRKSGKWPQTENEVWGMLVYIISNLWVWTFGLEVIVATLRRSSLDNRNFKLLKQRKAQKELKL
jgi:hypothetical protein